MTEFVVIRFNATDSAVQWILVDDNGTRQSRVATGSLDQAAGEVGDRAVIVLVPATDVLTTSVHIPVRGAAKLRAALPFALEEDLADDIESLHFAAGKPYASGRLPVAIVAREKMDDWLSRLSAAGITAAKIVSEIYGLASIPGTMSLLVDDDRSLYNDGADAEFVMQGVTPRELLVAVGRLDAAEDEASGESTSSGHLVAFCTAQQETDLSADWSALRQELDSVDVNVLPDGVLPKLAVTIASGKGVNLLQGHYGPTADYVAYFAPWKLAAALLLGFALLLMTARGVDYYRLGEEEAALRAQFTVEYRYHNPGDTREVMDPLRAVASIKRGMGRKTSPQVFLPSLRELGLAVAANSAAQIQLISYRAGIMDIRLTTADVATLVNIQKAVSASGRFQAAIQSTDQVADKIDGRIRIRESGS
ncbi:MAG: hypothetical protein IID57_02355 [Proteobacteria bacterium]|nr:hypothetical protein [Pseudomonadota bacterium]